MAFNDTAKSTLILDGKQAEDQLKKLQTETKDLRVEMEKLRAANDLTGFEKLKKQVDENTKAQAALRKELFSVEKVMQNLSGASMNQLKAAQRAITAELNKMTRGTQEYIDKSKQLQSVNKEIGKVRTELNGASGAGESAWGKIGMAATKFMGVAAAAWGVIKSGQVIIESTSALSDKWTEALGGVKSGFHSITQAVANMDFSNFWANTTKAIEVGREIARMEDELEDKTRVLTVLESKYQLEISKQKDIAADKTKSDAEQKAALQTAIDLEYKLNALRESNAELNYSIKEKAILQETKLTAAELQGFLENYNKNDAIREQAVKYNEALLNIAQTETDIRNAQKSNTKTGIGNDVEMLQENLKYFQKTIKEVDPQVKTYAALLTQYGKGADTTIDNYINAWANVYNTKRKVFEETLRIKQRETSFEKKEDKTQLIDKKKNLDLLTAEIDKAYNQRRLLLVQSAEKDKVNQDWYDQTLLANEIAYLKLKEEAIRNAGEDTLTLQQDIAQKEIDLNNKIADEKDRANKKKEQSDKEYFASEAERLRQQEEDIWNQVLGEENARDVAIEKFKDQMDQYKSISDNIGSSMGAALGNFIANNEASSEEFGKAMILTMLDALHAIVRMSIAAIYAQSLSQPDSVLTFGASGIGRAIIISALAEAAFAAVKGVVSSSMGISKVSQRYAGKYDVIGADDGRSYSANYGGPMRTGIYDRPTLVAERSDEVVIDGATTRNLMVNFPNVLPTIMAARVPQRADGNYQNISGASGPAADPEQKAINRMIINSISKLDSTLRKGIKAGISYSNLKDGLDKGQAAEDRGSKP